MTEIKTRYAIYSVTASMDIMTMGSIELRPMGYFPCLNKANEHLKLLLNDEKYKQGVYQMVEEYYTDDKFEPK